MSAESAADLPAFLRVDELAEFLRVSRWAIYDSVKVGQIRAVHVGRSVRIPRTELDRLLGGDS